MALYDIDLVCVHCVVFNYSPLINVRTAPIRFTNFTFTPTSCCGAPTPEYASYGCEYDCCAASCCACVVQPTKIRVQLVIMYEGKA